MSVFQPALFSLALGQSTPKVRGKDFLKAISGYSISTIPELIVSDGQQMEPRPGDVVLGTPHRSNSTNPVSDMSSPRPFDLVLGFTPSTYQKAVFE
ncbi:MAG TPA: hypothetical protein V6C91_02625 [Coleofasciculaceae cyanobacterium]